MTSFARYGSNSSFTNTITDKELEAISSQELLDIIHNLTSKEHKVQFYGPTEISDLKELIVTYHKTNDLNPIKPVNLNKEREMNSSQVFVVDYDMKQAEIVMYAKGPKYDKDKYSIIKLHNEYFGGGMSSIVFQDLRESKALAYSVYSAFTIPKKASDSHYQFSYIGTQADKLAEAMDGMLSLLTQMPEAVSNFENSLVSAFAIFWNLLEPHAQELRKRPTSYRPLLGKQKQARSSDPLCEIQQSRKLYPLGHALVI